ncbi:MAG: 30S ribosomal protein S9 [Candidatus Pacebacteria bacterium]|nr:30S ribosomal protein S9 [Candidatus Paceibacterota bacterium]
MKKEKYFEGVGRRKTSIARVRFFPQTEKSFSVNEKPLEGYFPTKELQYTVLSPLSLMSLEEQSKVMVRVKGGGISSQAEAVRHGISKALVLFNADFRKKLKKAGFLTRDPRMRERKKFGLKRARRAPQWAKR